MYKQVNLYDASNGSGPILVCIEIANDVWVLVYLNQLLSPANPERTHIVFV